MFIEDQTHTWDECAAKKNNEMRNTGVCCTVEWARGKLYPGLVLAIDKA